MWIGLFFFSLIPTIVEIAVNGDGLTPLLLVYPAISLVLGCVALLCQSDEGGSSEETTLPPDTD